MVSGCFVVFAIGWQKSAKIEKPVTGGTETAELSEQAKAVEAALTPEIRKRLVAYAYKHVKGMEWPGETGLLELAQDLASEAVCKGISGGRVWNQDLTPSVLDFLFSAVLSETNNRWRNIRNRLLRSELDGYVEDTVGACDGAERKMEADEFFYGLMLELEGDEICQRIVDLFEQGLKRSEVIKASGLSESEFDAGKKRIQRKTQEYMGRRQAEANTL